MAGFKDVAAAKRRRLARMEEALAGAKGARTGGTMRRATPAPARAARKIVQPKVTPAQKVRSISGGTGARDARMAEIKRRMAEIMSSNTTPDRRN